MAVFRRDLVFIVLYVSLAIVSLNKYANPHVISNQKDITGKHLDLLKFLSTELSATPPAIKDSNVAVTGDDESALEESRGRKGKKRMSRYLYPVLIGLFMTKMIVFPLLLKALTIMSSASFVLSKMSLLTSVLLGFKWFLTNNQQQPMAQAPRPAEPAKVEIVHVPMKKYETGDWDREANNRYHVASGDNYDPYYNELKPTTFVK